MTRILLRHTLSALAAGVLVSAFATSPAAAQSKGGSQRIIYFGYSVPGSPLNAPAAKKTPGSTDRLNAISTSNFGPEEHANNVVAGKKGHPAFKAKNAQ